MMIPHMYPDWQILTSSTASTPKSFLFLPLAPSIYPLHSSRTSLLNHVKEHHSLLKTNQYTPLGLKCHVFFLGDFPYYLVKLQNLAMFYITLPCSISLLTLISFLVCLLFGLPLVCQLHKIWDLIFITYVSPTMLCTKKTFNQYVFNNSMPV